MQKNIRNAVEEISSQTIYLTLGASLFLGLSDIYASLVAYWWSALQFVTGVAS
jgi:hypothetical protein